MGNPKKNAALVLLAVLMLAVCFAAGFLLMPHDSEPEAPSAVREQTSRTDLVSAPTPPPSLIPLLCWTWRKKIRRPSSSGSCAARRSPSPLRISMNC